MTSWVCRSVTVVFYQNYIINSGETVLISCLLSMQEKTSNIKPSHHKVSIPVTSSAKKTFVFTGLAHNLPIINTGTRVLLPRNSKLLEPFL